MLEGVDETKVDDEFLRYFWQENFGNSTMQRAANSCRKFMDPRRSLGRAS